MTTREHALWLLEEADRLDKAAADWTGPPDRVASAAAMTTDWVTGILGPDQLHRLAKAHRARAAQIANSLTNRRTRP